ncbi:MAG: peptide-methionine (R)-S-oxide reductase MsrB, partial [Actinomycetota bacterium]|nr:peptide-methionine (R)-S-oxide reductase MsrB [Actinomycetota bacterium]
MTDMPETDAQWREKLTPEQYQVLRQGGTERAFTGEHWDSKTQGTYKCAGCGAELFSSTTKFESGSGWPSFFQTLDPESIEEVDDRSFGMVRTEIRCRNCGGHLGHLFDDGPNPTGLRYCVNSASIDLEEKDGEKD